MLLHTDTLQAEHTHCLGYTSTCPFLVNVNSKTRLEFRCMAKRNNGSFACAKGEQIYGPDLELIMNTSICSFA